MGIEYISIKNGVYSKYLDRGDSKMVTKDQTLLEQAADLLKALSNESRLKIVCILDAQGEKSVGELEQMIGLSQSALSQHLALLRRKKILKTRRHAQTIYYSCLSDPAKAIIKKLEDLYGTVIC
jgi:DNA-binding transcriptional ArsR family regulator